MRNRQNLNMLLWEFKACAHKNRDVDVVTQQ